MTTKLPHHGILTDQFKNTAASPSSVTSVTTALPSLNNNPPTAGRRAKASGAECQFEGSSCDSSLGPYALGRRMSSVEERIDCCASSIESENMELRLRPEGLELSPSVDARPGGLWRRLDGAFIEPLPILEA